MNGWMDITSFCNIRYIGGVDVNVSPTIGVLAGFPRLLGRWQSEVAVEVAVCWVAVSCVGLCASLPQKPIDIVRKQNFHICLLKVKAQQQSATQVSV